MKYKLIFDSTVGHSKSEIESRGAGFVPINIDWNGKTYLSGVDINTEELVSKMSLEDTIRTSAVTLGAIEEAFTKGLEDHDHIVYFSISKGISSSMNNAIMVSKEDEFAGKVTVIDSEFTTAVLKDIAFELIEKSKKLSLEEFIELANFYNRDQVIFALPGSMAYLKKSGRVTKAQYILGSLLKVQPVIVYAEGNMTTRPTMKARGFNKGVEKALESFSTEIKNGKYDDVNIRVGIVASGEKSEYFKNEVMKYLTTNGISKEAIYDAELDTAIMSHIGPEVYCIAINKEKK